YGRWPSHDRGLNSYTRIVVLALDVLLDRCTHQVPPLCPGAVIIPHARVTQQIHQDKPGVARALPNAAIGNGVITGFEASSAFVEFFELLDVLERGIRSHGLSPGNIRCPGNVATA